MDNKRLMYIILYLCAGLAFYCGLITVPEIMGRLWLFAADCHFQRFVNHVNDFYFLDTYINLGIGTASMVLAAWIAKTLQMKSSRFFVCSSMIFVNFLLIVSIMQPLGILITYGDFIERQHM